MTLRSGWRIFPEPPTFFSFIPTSGLYSRSFLLTPGAFAVRVSVVIFSIAALTLPATMAFPAAKTVTAARTTPGLNGVSGFLTLILDIHPPFLSS